MIDKNNLGNFLYANINVNEEEKEYLNFLGKCFSFLGKTTSQNFQDVWILHETNYKENGFFVEFGATNGVDCSNTRVLEQNYSWNGILAEPNIFWHEDLFNNRKCSITKKCVYSKSNEILLFSCVENAQDLSTIKGYGKGDEHENARKNCAETSVRTISLLDLLKEHNAPKEIDYLSIDTEGSEFEILNSFFASNENYQINHITVEHNYNNELRDNIKSLLERIGYKRKFVELSRWDDFYILG